MRWGFSVSKGMSKEARVTVRMSEELDAWVQTEAGRREMDKAAFIRLVLAERKAGLDHPVMVVPPPTMVGQQFEGAGATHVIPADHAAHPEFDIDDLVNDALEHADAQGLTAHQPREEELLMEEAGARSLSRRPTRYSPASGPAHLRDL